MFAALEIRLAPTGQIRLYGCAVAPDTLNRGWGNQVSHTMVSESVVKIEGVLFTGFGSRSLLQTWFGRDDLFGTLEVSRDYLSIAGWWSPKYEVRKELIEKLIFREHRMLKGLRFARLRVLHTLPGAPEYILFVTRSATDLKAALINAGYTLEPVH